MLSFPIHRTDPLEHGARRNVLTACVDVPALCGWPSTLFLCRECHRCIVSFQGQLACPESRVSKALKAEREVPGFQVSQVHRAIPVKEVPPGHRGHQVSLGLQAVQVSISRWQELGRVWGFTWLMQE